MGDTLTLTAVGLPAWLSFDGATFSGTPDQAAVDAGTAAVTVTASDGTLSVTDTFDVDVSNVNDAPVAQDDAATTNEEVATTVDVLALVSDVDDVLVAGDITITGAPANGALFDNADGTYTYTPTNDFFGSDSFTYQVADGNGGVATGVVSLTVNNVDDDPTAVGALAGQAATQDINFTFVVPTESVFADADGDKLVLTAQLAGGAALPTWLTFDGNVGLFTGTPDQAAINGGNLAIEVIASDGAGMTATQPFTLTLVNVNDAPVAVGDTGAVNEDASVNIDVLANDTDPDPADVAGLTVTSAVANNGTVVIEANNTLTYTPTADFSGTDTISYAISDGNGGTATASVAVTVTEVADAPVFGVADFAVATDEDNVLSGRVPAATDADGDALEYDLGATVPTKGVVVVADDGSFVYTPTANATGADSFTVTVTDNDVTTADATITVNVTINALNDGPVAVNDAAATNEDTTSAAIVVLANDTDVESDPLSVTSAVAGNGTVAIVANELFYTPATDFNGVDTIAYTISDGNGGTATAQVTVTVAAVNDAPTFDFGAVSFATDEDVLLAGQVPAASDVDGPNLVYSLVAASAVGGTAVVAADGTFTFDPTGGTSGNATFDVQVTDSDPTTPETATITVNIAVAPVNDAPTAADNAGAQTFTEDTATTVTVTITDGDSGTTSITSAEAGNGTVAINNATGELTYTPNADFNGADTITYTVSDGDLTATNTVAITVGADNDASVLGDDQASTQEDVAVVLQASSLLSNDSDVDDGLSIASAVLSGGDTTVNGATVAVDGSGNITYTPSGDFNGQAEITYTTNTGSTATVFVDVGPTNDAPVATSPGALTAAEGDASGVIGTVTSTDADGAGDVPTFEIIGGNAAGLFSIANPATGAITLTGTGAGGAVDDADVGSYELTVRVTDGSGAADEVAVTVTISDVNAQPVITSGANATGAEDTTFFTLLTATDGDGDALTFTGTLATPADGTLTVAPSGLVIFVPAADFNGNAIVNFTVDDGTGGLDATAAGTLTINMVASNDAPVVAPVTVTTDEDVALTGATEIDVLTTASDVDLDTLSVTGAAAGNGTVTINGNGSLNYTPDANFNGADTIIFTVSDGAGGVTHGTVAVTVTSVDDAAVAGDDTADLMEDVATTLNRDGPNTGTLTASGNLLANDADVEDGAAASVTTVGGLGFPAPGERLEIQATVANNVFDVDANGDAAGTAVGLENGQGVPAVNFGTLIVFEDGSYQFEVSNGLTQSLGVNDSVIVRFPYVNDQGAAANLDITIRGTNDGPVASDDFASINENATTIGDHPANDPIPDAPGSIAANAFTIDVLDNDADPDRTDSNTNFTLSDLSVTGVSDVVGAVGPTAFTQNAAQLNGVAGLLTIVNDELVFTPGTSFDELDAGDAVDITINYTVTDPDGLSDNTGTLVVRVTGTNDAPVLTGTTADLDEAAAQTGQPAPALNDNGNLNFTDVDLDDNDHTVSATLVSSGVDTGAAIPATLESYLTLGPVTKAGGDSTGTVTYDFTAPDDDFDYLADGEDLVLTYTVTIDDQTAGGTDTADIVVTITGSNDRPVLSVVGGNDVIGAVAEDDTAPNLTDTGTITLTDVDLTDTHTVAVAINSTTPSAGVTVDAPTQTLLDAALTANVSTAATGTGTGEVTWNFEIANSAAQFLAEGETITVVYDVTVTDDSTTANDASAVQQVTVTLTGTNDAPDITVEAGDSDAETLVESLGADSTGVFLSTTGTLSLEDIDVTDTVDATKGLDASIVTGGSGNGANTPSDAALNAMFTVTSANPQIDGSSTTASIGWEFDSDPSAFDYLGANQTQTIQYTITAEDDSGTGNDTDTQTVTITIQGTNDGPTLDLDANDSSGAATATGYDGTFTENGGAVAIVDTDSAIADVDQDATINLATITLANAQVGDTLDFATIGLPVGVVGAYDGSGTATLVGGVVTVAGTVVVTLTAAAGASLADMETALEAIRFDNDEDDPATADRNITVTIADDQGATASAASTIEVGLDLTQSVHVLNGATVVGTFDTIQGAIDALAAGGTANGDAFPAAADTISVFNTYAANEDITISEGLNLEAAAGAGSTVTVASITIDGGAVGDSVTIDGIDVTAVAQANAIEVDGGATYTSITYTNGDVTGGTNQGFFLDDAANVLAVTISEAIFSGNATVVGAGAGEGAITFFDYNGDVTLTNVAVTNPGAGAENGIQFNGAGATPFNPIGTVTLTGVTVDGVFEKTGVAIYQFSDINGLNINGTAGAGTSDGLDINVAAGFAGLNIDVIGGDVDLSDGSALGLAVANTIVGVGSISIQSEPGTGVNTFIGDSTSNTLVGNDGNDTLTGGDALDLIIGGDGDDSLTGNGGDDGFIGGDGADDMSGGLGNDNFLQFVGDGAGDQIDGGGATIADAVLLLDASPADDTVAVTLGAGGITSLDGAAIVDVEIITAAVDTTLGAVPGTFAALAGGTDTLDYTGSTVATTVDLATGDATGFFANPLLPGVGGPATAISGFENVTGGTGDDDLTGDAGANVLTGSSGADDFTGSGGLDTFIGGTAALDDANTTNDAATFAAGMIAYDLANGVWTVDAGGGNVTTLVGIESVTIGGTTTHLVDKDANGGYETITEALAAADPGDNILIGDGTYAEDIVIAEGVNLQAFNDGTVDISGNGGANAVTINGGGVGQAVSIDGIVVSGGADANVAVAPGADYDAITLQDVDLTGAGRQAFSLNGAPNVDAITIAGTAGDAAAISGFGAVGAGAGINIGDFNGDVTISNVAITAPGVSSSYGINITGDDTGALMAAGAISITDVTIDDGANQYANGLLAIQDYSDASNPTLTNITLTGNITGDVFAPLFIDEVGGTLDASGVTIVGSNADAAGPFGSYIQGAAGEDITLTGTAAADEIVDGAANAVIDAGAGNDQVIAVGGVDTVMLGTGDDTLITGPGGALTLDGGEDVGDADVDTLVIANLTPAFIPNPDRDNIHHLRYRR